MAKTFMKSGGAFENPAQQTVFGGGGPVEVEPGFSTFGQGELSETILTQLAEILAAAGISRTTAFAAPGAGATPLVGPGLKEPMAEYTLKEWKVRVDCKEGDFNLQYYLVKYPGQRKKILMYNQRTREWKHWYPARNAVIGKNMPSHKMVTRLRRMLKRHKDDAATIMKLTDPLGYARKLGYKKYKRR